MYRYLAIANYEDRFVIPTSHQEISLDDYHGFQGQNGFSFGNDSGNGQSPFALFPERRKESMEPREPAPMADDYPARIAADQAWVIEEEGRLIGALILEDTEDGLLLDNIAVAPTAAEGTLSSQTSGLRLNGVVAGVSYALEYAQQKDYGDNPLELDSEYYLAELGYTLKGVQLKAGYEVLGGDGGTGNRAFQTPLATKHAFQGWADMFLTTPADGIEDAYVGVTAPLLGGQVQAWYHDYSAEQGSDSYGDEINLSYGRPIPAVPGLVALVKYASYDADTPKLRGGVANVDTDKLWLQLQYTY